MSEGHHSRGTNLLPWIDSSLRRGRQCWDNGGRWTQSLPGTTTVPLEALEAARRGKSGDEAEQKRKQLEISKILTTPTPTRRQRLINIEGDKTTIDIQKTTPGSY